MDKTNAPPVLWVVVDKDNRYYAVATDEQDANALAKGYNPRLFAGAPFRVVAYVPRDTP